MCDFHDFGLIFAGQMYCLPQRLKSTFFERFSNGGCPKHTRSVEKISNNIDFSLWGNRATTWEYFLTFLSETKIMKIIHSGLSWLNLMIIFIFRVNRNGTCYTTTECTDEGGTASGNCASGFGICCLFTLSSSSSLTVSQNNTYIQNPSFPSVYTDTTALTYTINKCADSKYNF